MTPPHPIPAPGFHENPGSFPDLMDKETLLRVQFANGRIDDKHTYKPTQLFWSKRGYEWDVAAVALAG